MKKVEFAPFVEPDSPDLGIRPMSEVGKMSITLYIWAQKNNFASQMQIIFNWLDQWIDTPKELAILKYLVKLRDEGNISALQAIADMKAIEMGSTQEWAMAA